MPNAFVIECLAKDGKLYYLDEQGEFDSNLTAPKLKKWKTQKAAEKHLEGIKNDLTENADIKKIGVAERSQEIQSALDKEEARKFEQDFNSIRSMATAANVVNSGSVYRKMRLRLAEGLVALIEGDSILYFPEGYTGTSQIVTVEKVGILTLNAAGISANRLTGNNCFLPSNSELVDYFVAYAQIQEFIKQNWEVVQASDLIQISKKITNN